MLYKHTFWVKVLRCRALCSFIILLVLIFTFVLLILTKLNKTQFCLRKQQKRQQMSSCSNNNNNNIKRQKCNNCYPIMWLLFFFKSQLLYKSLLKLKIFFKCAVKIIKNIWSMTNAVPGIFVKRTQFGETDVSNFFSGKSCMKRHVSEKFSRLSRQVFWEWDILQQWGKI